MKEIDRFVESIVHHAGGNEQEIRELKTEMKYHLLEAVHDLIREGKSERETVQIAIKRFGGETTMRYVIGQLFRKQKVFAKRMLYAAISFLVLTLILCGALWAADEQQMTENLAVAENIAGMLENGVTVKTF